MKKLACFLHARVTTILAFLWLVSVVADTCPASSPRAARPNIVLIIAAHSRLGLPQSLR
jgi:hypothetical protein